MHQSLKNQGVRRRRLPRLRRIIGLILWLFAVLLCLSFISYLFTWQADQSPVLNGVRDKVHNTVGFFGAYLSHHCFYNGFGLSAFWLVILMFIWGYRFLARGRLRLRKITFNIWFMMFYGSIISAYLLPTSYKDSFPFSGAVGEKLNDFLRHTIGDTGAFIVLFLFLPFMFFALAFGLRLPKKKAAPPVKTAEESAAPENLEPSALVTGTQTNQADANNPGTISELERSLFAQFDHAPSPNQFNNNVFDATLAQEPIPEEQPSGASDKHESSFEIIQKEPAVLEPANPVATNSPEPNPTAGSMSEPLPSPESEVASASVPAAASASIDVEPKSSVPAAKDVPSPESRATSQESPAQPMPAKPEPAPQAREGVYVSKMAHNFTAIPQNRSAAQVAANSQDPSPEPQPIGQPSSTPPANPFGSASTPYEPRAELSFYQFPSKDLLREYPENTHLLSPFEISQNEQRIASLLRKFDIKFSTVRATVGSTVTLYEVATELTENLRKIENRAPNLAMALEAISVRIMIPVPGKSVVGIEVPNKKQSIVGLRNLLFSTAFQQSNSILPIALGRTIDNMPFILDLVEMPHLLIAGATKQGKSVGINTILLSLLYKQHPAELKLVLIDPKQVELGIYELIERHYLAKMPSEEQAVIKDSKKAVHTLQSLVLEMEHRLSLMSVARVRDIAGYNAKFRERQLNPNEGHKFLPFIVVVVDEYADLVMTEKGVEKPLIMLAQKARAAGIHLIVATQRPSADVLVGMIKANCPGRLAFRVAQATDSRIILDENGAENLIGRGDMLVKTGDVGGVKRVQCAFVSTEEVDAVVNFISKQQAYPKVHELPEYSTEEEEDADKEMAQGSGKRDSLFAEIARAVVRDQRVSASSLQARYSIGQPRATRIVLQLERAGIIGPLRAGKREVLMSDLELEDLLDTLNNA